MKTISIWRHAKAERPELYANDYDRPLTERGVKDAARMGAVIMRLDPAIDLIIGSPAARTAQTVQSLVTLLDGAIDPLWNAAAYLAAADTLLEMVKALPDDAQHVVLVGHNPGMEELASGLCGSTPEDVFVRMPTAALAHVSIDVSHWSMVRWGAGQLKLLLTPKILR
ncbi:histidine phosphatase family protein [Caldilinea sp.]|uniref:SixA phosphatase family protein n=1 Tax=Caldilinea sp. TaxID=2293560 RepID=UPI002BA2489B|nr:histidine phosphatase family protein [Anaerolineales bacterium]HQY94891.1 histidine phosphatase family protein [Caldilinea sp.]HRA65367.1 histidine phosphatase family protein [Caldilinea sp.]